jgi:hypothetical protein
LLVLIEFVVWNGGFGFRIQLVFYFGVIVLKNLSFLVQFLAEVCFGGVTVEKMHLGFECFNRIFLELCYCCLFLLMWDGALALE